jgi:hypothetical protein
MLIAVLGAFAVCAAAHAQSRGCPHNDKHLPEKSSICKAGAIWICEDGQWQRRDGTRC